MRSLFLGMALFFIGQVLIWFQTNGQFISKWIKDHPLLVSLCTGTLISYIFIKATALVAGYYGGALWSARLIGFAMGIISFTFLTWILTGESLTAKTSTCVALSFIILSIQIFWK